MTLREALQMSGVYGRMVKPWKPDGVEAMKFEPVRVSADRTLVGSSAESVGRIEVLLKEVWVG